MEMKSEIESVSKETKSEIDAKEHVMTLNDVANELVKDLRDEIDGACKYKKMAEVVDRAKHCKDGCYYLMEMAKDEYTHAKFIRSFMKDHHIPVPEEDEEDFEKLEEKMAKFFR